MLHVDRISHALHYIEEHLHDSFSLEDVSKAAFSSLSYMHRIFYQMTGLTMKEYIRQRRLAKAASLLQDTNHTILHIALDSGYQTSESFSRAFKRQYSVSPSECRNQRIEIITQQPIDISRDFIFKQPEDLDFNLQLTAISLPKTTICGFITETCMQDNKHIKDICEFANHYLTTGLLNKYFDQNKTEFYGVYTDMTSQDEFKYTIGGLDQAIIDKEQGMVTHTLPATTYAKFTLDRNDRIKEAWHYIYGAWFPQIEELRSHGFDFEIYHLDSTDIYIPMERVPCHHVQQ